MKIIFRRQMVTSASSGIKQETFEQASDAGDDFDSRNGDNARFIVDLFVLKHKLLQVTASLICRSLLVQLLFAI